jgi:hypothetical protein
MSMGYHINGRGEAAKCQRRSSDCDFGSEDEHWETAEEARAEFESWFADMTIPTPLRKKPREPQHQQPAVVRGEVVRPSPVLPSPAVSLPPAMAPVEDDGDAFEDMFKDLLA